jgi:hypothetical protein
MAEPLRRAGEPQRSAAKPKAEQREAMDGLRGQRRSALAGIRFRFAAIREKKQRSKCAPRSPSNCPGSGGADRAADSHRGMAVPGGPELPDGVAVAPGEAVTAGAAAGEGDVAGAAAGTVPLTLFFCFFPIV